MPTLDNISAITKLDSQGMLESIKSLGNQCRQAWEDVQKISLPRSYQQVQNVHLNGMGGSALGADVAWHLFQDSLRVPFTVTNQYTIPHWVNGKTLCILSSYSGTTEEVVASFHEARKRNAKILIICAGGRLKKLAAQYRLPAYVFDPKHNPSNQPRMAVGYSLVGIVALLRKAKVLTVTEKEMSAAADHLDSRHSMLGIDRSRRSNPAKKIAREMCGRVPIIIASEHLSGAAHIFANQTNENGKNFAAYFLISEMNHHLMEGLAFPRRNPEQLQFVFFESDLYQKRNIQRVAITKRVLRAKKIPYASYQVRGGTRLAHVYDALVFSSYASFYLSMLNTIDPSPIPVVDYFKKELKK